MLKGLTESQQKHIEQIIFPFMYIETTIRKNGLILTPETLTVIKEVQNVADYALANELSLPKSSYDILRYGSTVETEIFKNLDKLSQYAKVKLRVRKGIQYSQVLTWDIRSIENILKKTDKPKIKSQDDKKVFKEFLTSFSDFNNFNSDVEQFNKYKKLFMAKNSPYTIHFTKGFNILQDYEEKMFKLAQREKERSIEQSHLNSLDTDRQQIEQKIIELKEKFYSENKTGRGIKTKKDQIESLEKVDPLASYLKLLGEIIETFDAYATKQNVNLTFEEQNVLRDLKISLITHEKNIDQYFGQLLTVIIRHADVAFGKKHWYMKLLQELGSVDKLDIFIRSGSGFKAWLEAREFAKDVYELQQTAEFNKFQENLSQLEETKKKITDNRNRVNERFTRFVQDIKELQEPLSIIKENLFQWSKEAKELF
jgi:hypothetical protein